MTTERERQQTAVSGTFMCESAEFNGPHCLVQCASCKPKPKRGANETVHFRLIVCPECNHNLCWVNPRLPSYCPECGKHIYPAVRSAVHVSDEKATLRYSK